LSDEEAKRGTPNMLAMGMLLVAAAFAVGVVAYLFVAGGDDGPEVGMIDDHRPEEGGIAPDFALLDVRDGETVRRLSDYRGQVVVLNWYASWCGPCAAEIPEFQEAQDALEGELVFLLVNLEEPRDRAVQFLEGLNATMTSVWDRDGDVARHYRLQGMPTTFFIDRDGTISVAGRGFVSEEALRNALGDLGLEY
jgi:cytochrome c biogenesis protein CcmG, thiol:disulfide interchange protein DsbE